MFFFVETKDFLSLQNQNYLSIIHTNKHLTLKSYPMANKLESKYFDKLEYDKELDNSWYAFFIDRKRFTFLVIMVIMIAGWIGLKSLPLESNPEVKI
jgi:hypothetical protein